MFYGILGFLFGFLCAAPFILYQNNICKGTERRLRECQQKLEALPPSQDLELAKALRSGEVEVRHLVEAGIQVHQEDPEITAAVLLWCDEMLEELRAILTDPEVFPTRCNKLILLITSPPIPHGRAVALLHGHIRESYSHSPLWSLRMDHQLGVLRATVSETGRLRILTRVEDAIEEVHAMRLAAQARRKTVSALGLTAADTPRAS